ncbi:MAG: helicase associated domain-containing protein [Clostridia bacterium]|nr:helicase associated domain-containing protein [Clostridia bacterium]
MENFDAFLKYITNYHKRNYDIKVPYDYMTRSGYPLGKVVDQIRFNGVLNKEQEKQLVKMGFNFEPTGKTYKFDFHEVYTRLLNFKALNNNLNITKKYVESDGYPLGEKVYQIREGYVVLTGAQDDDLDNINFVWQEPEDTSDQLSSKTNQVSKKVVGNKFNFAEFYSHLQDYKKENGDLFISSNYKTKDGYPLGSRAANLRNENIMLSENDKLLLDDMGFMWKLPEDKKYGKRTFDLKKYVTEATAFIAKNGKGIPKDFVTEDGYKLGEKTSYVRRHSKYKNLLQKYFPDFNIENTMMERGKKSSANFDEIVCNLIAYKNSFGNLEVKVEYVSDDGYKLGSIVQRLRSGSILISDEQRKILDDMGFIWKSSRDYFDFDRFYSELVKYKQQKGNLLIPAKYETKDGYKLGLRIVNLRNGKIHLKENEIDKINQLGFVWKIGKKTFDFDLFYDQLFTYNQEFNTTKVPRSYVTQEGYQLGKKVDNVRSGLVHINEIQLKKLNKLGFKWKIQDRNFNFAELLLQVKLFKRQNNDVKIPSNYVTKDGYKLGKKLGDVKCGNIKTSLVEKEILESEGVVFSEVWQEKYDRGFKRVKTNKNEDEQEKE